MKASEFKTRWYGVQLPLDGEGEPLVRLLLSVKNELFELKVEARTPLQAHFALVEEMKKLFHVNDVVAQKVISRLNLLPDDNPFEPNAKGDEDIPF